MSDCQTKAPSTAEKKRARLRADLERAERERKRLKWFLVLALVTSPLGLLKALWVALWIFAGWICLWLVGLYMNFFHLRAARARLREAERAS